MKYFVLATVVVVALGAPLGAQQSSESQRSTLFRSGASLVALSVTVTDTDKRLVTGLDAGDFAVYEDGVRQQLRFFESSAVPIDLILLIDTSSSMYDKMALVHEAGAGVVQLLRPGDRGAVVAFNDNVNVVQPLTGDVDLLTTAIRNTRGKGGTALHNAIYVSLKQFGRSARQGGEVRRQAIAVLSDGEDTASLIGFEELMQEAQKSGVSVYPIGLQSGYAAVPAGGRRYFSQTQYSLRKIAQETGAQAFFPQDIAELNGIYATIAEELTSQYSLGYSPSNARADGRYRRIIVKVPTRPELRPRTRTGYLAQAAGAALVEELLRDR
ncbi:MAG TPA: VWA domain-containing protein [Vicinamibacterales bacterium]|nr:VWA domain-containing protein [Vicinamibacterales bacterium]